MSYASCMVKFLNSEDEEKFGLYENTKFSETRILYVVLIRLSFIKSNITKRENSKNLFGIITNNSDLGCAFL